MTAPLGHPSHAGGQGHPTVLDLLANGVLDAELAAVVWLLVDSRVPLIVAGSGRSDRNSVSGGPGGGAGPRPGPLNRRATLAAMLDLIPPLARQIPVDAGGGGLDRLTSADAATTWLVGPDVGPEPAYGLRLAFRALSRGAVLAASVEADSLEDVRARLGAPDVRLSEDELTFLGVVLVLRVVPLPSHPASPAGPASRVVAAHYVRPVARDPAGHLQRLPPAVLATWDARTDTFEHFAWGLAAEIAGRSGLRPGDVDGEVERRRSYLVGLLAGGVSGSNQLRRALEGYRMADSRGSAG
jgi:hypothetical protein